MSASLTSNFSDEFGGAIYFDKVKLGDEICLEAVPSYGPFLGELILNILNVFEEHESLISTVLKSIFYLIKFEKCYSFPLIYLDLFSKLNLELKFIIFG
jgi:predicted outer membrane repeat protein